MKRRPILFRRKAVTISARADEIVRLRKLREMAAQFGRRVIVKPKGNAS